MNRSRRVLRRLGIGIAVLIAAVVGITATTFVGAGLWHRLKVHRLAVSGIETSVYVSMSDGVQIAVDVALPPDFRPGQKIPALIKGTPYWRAAQPTFLGGAAIELKLVEYGEPDVSVLRDRGYAIVTVDTRGTGASFGYQKIMFDDDEVQDFRVIIDWVARRDWSNGRVGAYGFSYRGILAGNMASLGAPALKAVAPSFDFADLYITLYPGGVLSKRFAKAWSNVTAELNRGMLPCPSPCSLLFAGPKRVDTDSDGALVAAAILEHGRNYNVYDCAIKAPYRDDKICSSGKSFNDVSEISRRQAIERSGLPLYVVVGYFDANSAAQAIARYRSFSNPQQLVIGAISHGGFDNTDPFTARSSSVDPTYKKQLTDMADFFDRYLQSEEKPITKSIRYYVLGSGVWREDGTWPPVAATPTPWYLDHDHLLAVDTPPTAGTDVYDVDFTASSGVESRYQSPVDLSQTRYPDRATQDERLLTYTSPPLKADIEIAGDPVARLALSTTNSDGTVVVYLEDVSPEGKVTYLTEGTLRLANHKIADNARQSHSSDPLHTYLRSDSLLMSPGSIESIEVSMTPIAARLRKGHRIRVAIAGADADNLERIPATGDAVFTISRGGSGPSRIELPEVR